MKELIKIRDRIQGEYEDAVNFGTVDWREADGLLRALKIIEQRMDELIEKAGI